MINIISRSLSSTKTRGPKKVVENLIKGLEKNNIQYVINKQLDACNKLWIHDDVYALTKLKNLPQEINVIVGPNLYVNPEDIPRSIDLSRVVYIHPSENVKKIWEKRGYKGKIEVWPVGIDTAEYSPTKENKDTVLIYFKNRKSDELNYVTETLKKKGVKYRIIKYGKYDESSFRNALIGIKYVIWIGIFESQGIALEEILSCNIPIVVCEKNPETSYDIESSSAPYFSNECGIKIKELKNIEATIQIMEDKYATFNPRNYVLDNLELSNQAKMFNYLYSKNFNVPEIDIEKINTDTIKEWKTENVFLRLIRKILK